MSDLIERNLPSAETHDKHTKTHACDCISRQSAIDALMELVEARHEWKSDASGEINGLNAAYCAIEDLPSVPQNLQLTCNQLATDCISRQQAIDVARKCSVKEVTPAYMLIDKAEVMTELMMLPSAQPEQDCVLKQFGNCSYGETGCSDCLIKTKIQKALSQPEPCDDAEYYRGKIDGIKECTARLRLLTAELKDREMDGGDANV